MKQETVKAGLTRYDILEKFNGLSAKKKIDILSEAIDVMQSYNGRSKATCIALAMGYETTDGETYEKYEKI